MSRQIALDTETTGLSPEKGHRVIEIGCIEIIDRKITQNDYHCYLQPDREVEPGAVAVHGINNAFLEGKPRFEEVVSDFIEYIKGAELIIHNAPFDVGFLDAELARVGATYGKTRKHSTVLDTLVMARKKHPGQKNTLDALCKRYKVDNTQRDLHGALLDAQLLAQVYLNMTGGQISMSLDMPNNQPATSPTKKRSQQSATTESAIHKNTNPTIDLPVIKANEAELKADAAFKKLLEKA